MINKLRSDLTAVVIFAACSFIAGIVLSKDVFETFTPRSYVFHDAVLTFLQAATSLGLFLCFSILSVYNFLLYKNYRSKLIPFKGFHWMYSVRSISVAIVFIFEFINIFAAYYWLDSIVRILALLFSTALVIMQVVYYPAMKNMKTPEEYAELADELEKVRMELQELKDTLK